MNSHHLEGFCWKEKKPSFKSDKWRKLEDLGRKRVIAWWMQTRPHLSPPLEKLSNTSWVVLCLFLHTHSKHTELVHSSLRRRILSVTLLPVVLLKSTIVCNHVSFSAANLLLSLILNDGTLLEKSDGGQLNSFPSSSFKCRAPSKFLTPNDPPCTNSPGEEVASRVA